MHNRLTRFIHFCYALLVFVTPLIMLTQTSEMFEFPKILIIYVVASTVFAAWMIDFILYKRPIRFPSLAVAIGVFLASQMLATATSIDIHTSIFGYYGRFNGGLLSTIAYSTLFFVAVQTFDHKSFRMLLKVSLVTSLIVLFWGLPGRIVGVDMSCILFRGEFSTACWTNEFRPQERMFSTLGQPNWLGVYLLIHFFIGGFLWFTGTKSMLSHIRKPTKRTIAYAAYILLMALGVYFTGSRSSQIGLVGGVLIFALIFLWRKKDKILFAIVCMCVVLGVLVFGSVYVYKFLGSQSDDITHSGTIRLIVWEGAIKLAAKYPLTGTGPETFAYSYFLTRPEAHNYTTERDLIYNKAHNEFLNFLATTGILGLSAYVFMLCLMIRQLLKTAEGTVLACGIVGMSIANFFGFSTTTGQLFLFLIPVFALLPKERLPIESGLTARNRFRYVFAVVMVVIWGFTIRYFYQYYRADVSYAKATHLQYSNAYIESIEAFADALGYRFEHVYADKFALTIAQTAYLLSQADTEREYKEQIQSYVSMAESIQTAAVQSSSQNPVYWKDRVRMYRLIEDCVAEDKKEDIAMQIQSALSEARRLAPTDLEVREMVTSNGKQ